ncbi:hypothetical protein ACLMJK_004190 [Lecanora helva]
MPPTRRFKTLATALTIIICTILYLSNDSSSQEFYTRTVTALDKKATSDHEIARKLQEVKAAAREPEQIGVPSPQKPIGGDMNSDIGGKSTLRPADARSESEAPVNGDKSVAGRKTMKSGGTMEGVSAKESPKESSIAKAQNDASGKKSTVESEEEHEIESELNSILKKGPIIIFSKSYCPYSAKAKRILLEKYTIVPAPYVVELDTHPLGRGLQDALQKSTSRHTVPNVLINGRSIGGGDDIQALDDGGGLLDKVKGMAGKRIMEARLTEE